VSPLWTLQRLCFGPDVAAAYVDRGENRDPGKAIAKRKKQLTQEARLENDLPASVLIAVMVAALTVPGTPA